MSDIDIEHDGAGWRMRSQGPAYGEGSRVVHMDSGRVGSISSGTENPVTGRMHWCVDFDNGTRGVFQQRAIAPAQ